MKIRYELFEMILPFIKDKEILDVGCVDHELEKSRSPLWVHSFIKKYAKYVLGFDILKKKIRIT